MPEDLVGNPDSASKMVHNRARNDGRCHLDIANILIPFRNRDEIDRSQFPNNCNWCMN